MTDDGTVLVVDDLAQNRRLMDAILTPRGFTVVVAASGQEALSILTQRLPDVVLLDVLMPELDGYETCRRIRANPRTAFLPVVMVTASGERWRLRGLEAGADDFITKPLDQAELLARMRSLVRIKRYHDTVTTQAAQLRTWDRELSRRVAGQVADRVAEYERLDSLRRFLAPRVAQQVLARGDDGLLGSHRREITAAFIDLRGVTAFAETSEPEETMAVIGDYHRVLGELVFRFEGTLEHFAGDGLMVVFNDPVPSADAPHRAVSMAVAMRSGVADLAQTRRWRGHGLGFGVGIAQGYATLGRVGFEGRYDYTAIGMVTDVAARLCAEARDGQILVTPRVLSGITAAVSSKPVGPLRLRGFASKVEAFEVLDVQATIASS
ncbi:MAG TPA: response regulator [Pedococcus sp.]|nr:response regulator [Pedococcus sp.]